MRTSRWNSRANPISFPAFTTIATAGVRSVRSLHAVESMPPRRRTGIWTILKSTISTTKSFGASSILREAHEKMAAWANEAGVDLESTESQAAVAEHEQREQEADEHQLAELARQYAMTVQEWFAEEFVTEQNVHDDMMVDADGAAEIDVAAAAEVLRWYQFFVAAKVIRALMSRTLSDHSLVETTAGDNPFAETVEDEDDDFDAAPDYVQEDGNGSAKIGLIAIDRSMAAWHAMEMCQPGKSDSIAPIVAELERLRWLLEEEFPDARGFIRPGFDEADTELVN